MVSMSLSPRPTGTRPRPCRRPMRLRERRQVGDGVARSRAPPGCPRCARAAESPSSACASVTDTYCARSRSFRNACCGPDARVVEAGADRVRLLHLTVLVLQHVALHAVQHADAAGGERRGVTPRRDALARGLDADQLHARVVEERRESADRVRPPPTQATTASGSLPRAACSCARASSPITAWKSRTMLGTGAVPPRCPTQ